MQIARLLLLRDVECDGEEAGKEQCLGPISEGVSKCVNVLMIYHQHSHSWLRREQQEKIQL